MQFKVGDIVKTIKNIDSKITKGMIGKIVEITDEIRLGIEFNENIQGHSLNGKVKYNHGWYCRQEYITKINTNINIRKLNKSLIK